MSAKIPTHIRIGPAEFRVITVKDDDVSFWGEVRHKDALIRINECLEPVHAAAVLFEEVGHEIFYQTGLDEQFDAKQQDHILKGLGYALIDTLKRNPEMVEFLLDGEKLV